MELAYQTLQKYFGYTSFLPLQENIIKDTLSKNDVFALMPTGGGKSLCYQLPALLSDGVTVVVSPLIALMKDQVDSLRANGIASAYINSSLSQNEIRKVKLGLLEEKINILYVAPERITQSSFLSFLHKLNITLFAVDEAHCISEWGHDFRSEYRQLKLLKRYFPKTPIIALTATAIPEVQKDIINQLKLINPKLYKASFNRKNLFYQVKPKVNAYDQLIQYLKNHKKDSGIIYCYSRKSADDLSNKLKKDNYRALAYHAGLGSDLRAMTQNKFAKDDIEIIVATVAFGMGIDKPNIRFVIHYDMPKNLESYYQETGRAGRDGVSSDCILFFSYGDKKKIEYLIEQKNDEKEKQVALNKLREMVNFCEGRTCRRKLLLNYFGEKYDEKNCGNCDNCLNPKETIDGTAIAKKIISCTSQVGERFGMNYIAEVLIGSKSKKIIRNRHNVLRAYGTGEEYSKIQWMAFMRELIQLGYLELKGDRYPTVKLTKKSRDVLIEKEMVFLTKPEEKVQITQKSYDEGLDKDLFDVLRSLRKRLADSEGMPPYVIFHDSSLKAMATQLPRDLSEFQRINGVGQVKLKKYGDLFVKEIANYCKNHGIESKTFDKPSTAPSKKEKVSTLDETLKLYKQNFTIPEIAKKRNMSTGTIASHIEKLILEGEEIPIDKFVRVDKEVKILRAISILGSQKLAPIKKMLGDDYSYEEIRLVRAFILSERNKYGQNLSNHLKDEKF